MSRYNYVIEILAELGNEMGMGPLALDQTDRLSLEFDGVLVTLAYTSEPIELVWIHVDLGELPAEGIHVPQRLLQLGFECWAQNVMTIGLDEEGQNTVGYSSIPVSVLELPVLKEMLSRMLQATFLIREQLAQAAFEETQAGSPAEDLDAVPAHALGWDRA